MGHRVPGLAPVKRRHGTSRRACARGADRALGQHATDGVGMFFVECL